MGIYGEIVVWWGFLDIYLGVIEGSLVSGLVCDGRIVRCVIVG